MNNQTKKFPLLQNEKRNKSKEEPLRNQAKVEERMTLKDIKNIKGGLMGKEDQKRNEVKSLSSILALNNPQVRQAKQNVEELFQSKPKKEVSQIKLVNVDDVAKVYNKEKTTKNFFKINNKENLIIPELSSKCEEDRNSFVPVYKNGQFLIKVPESNKKLEDYDLAVKDNPQFVVEYVDDIFDDLLKEETQFQPNPNYFRNQADISENMRMILYEWLIDVHLKFKLNPETLYLTFNIIDRYLEMKSVNRSKLQLIGVTAMLIASKYEEIYAPEVRDFVYITERNCSKNEILQLEAEILSKLNFQVLCVYPYTFLERMNFITKAPKECFYMAQYVLENCLLDIKLYKYKPSELASGAIYLARKILNLEKNWPLVLEAFTEYKEKNVKIVAKDVCVQLDICFKNPKIKSLKTKFSDRAYLCVANHSFFNNTK